MAPIHNRQFLDPSSKPSAAGLQACGPILNVSVHIPTALAKLLQSQNAPSPQPAQGIALIDTGASNTCVHAPILTALGVNPIGVSTAHTAAGPTQQSRYPARLEFPAEGFHIEFSSVMGVDLSGQQVNIGGGSRPIIVLLGRDVLLRCLLIYNGPIGSFSLSL